MNKLAIIDSDSLCYQSERENCIESIEILDEKIQNIFDKTGCTHYVLFLSNGRYFRHILDPNYKIGREKYRDKVKWVKVLRQYLIAKWNAQWMEGVESDDLCAYWMNKDLRILKDSTYNNSIYIAGTNQILENEIIEKILCSPDKDLLLSIPGKHFNYSYKLDKDNISSESESSIKGWWVETTQEESNQFYSKQLLMGDSADGISALNGIGEVKAVKILKNWKEGNIETFILDYYIEYYKGDVPKAIFEFQKTYRLLHMLNCDEDFIREVGILPSFPVITEIKKEEIINTEF
jgi:5'-3' exonuclease